ncbi:MAG TPA: enoyl-CoA hydratase/isomerase family protein [Acidimicrobiia bacterium]|nr:enoyl-CoA hydratase/isomerase family protein [Acidimicrobiia bacterium]
MADPTYDTLRFDRHGTVGWLHLNRPEKLNAFTPLMWRELGELGGNLRDDPDLRALIVIGEGRAFSSGIDTSVFSDQEPADSVLGNGSARHPDPTVAAILAVQDSYSWLEEAPYVTIAAVHGYAFGAGLQLALACDIRVLARGTRLGLLEHQYGIIPDLGGTQRLPRLVGPGKALQLITTAARIDADEAERIGLAEMLVSEDDVETTAAGLAETIAAQPPLAVRAAKRAVRAAVSGLTVREGLVVEAEGQAGCLRSDDMREAITAFVEQRPPVYQGR